MADSVTCTESELTRFPLQTMGMRSVHMQNSFAGNADGGGMLHVS